MIAGIEETCDEEDDEMRHGTQAYYITHTF